MSANRIIKNDLLFSCSLRITKRFTSLAIEDAVLFAFFMSSLRLNQHWYQRRQLFAVRIPDEIKSWLFDPSSLTARLVRKCPGKFHVELLSQVVKRPTLDEIKALDLAYGDSALVREVHLYCEDKPVVYARTVIPLSTLKGAQRSYANLGNRPLGAMLFADKSMERDEVMVSLLMPEDALYVNTGAAEEAVWGRRSVFRVAGKPLLVSEYYLPVLFGS